MATLTFEPNSHSEWSYARLKESDGLDHHFAWHQPTGEIYNADTPVFIRFKAVCLAAVLTPIVTAIRIIYHAAMTILHTFLIQPFLLLDQQVTAKQAGEQIKNSFCDIFRSAIYGIGMIGCAVYAVGNAYNGRRLYGLLERTLNRHPDGPHRDKFYMAICFQPLVMNKDLNSKGDAKKAEKTALEKLERHLDFLDEARHRFGLK